MAADWMTTSTPRVATTLAIGDDLRIGRMIRRWTSKPARAPIATAPITDTAAE